MVFTVVHDYFRRNSVRNDKKSFMFFWTGFPDARPIRHTPAYLWKNMGNTDEGLAKDPRLKNDARAHAHPDDRSAPVGGSDCCTRFFEILFVVLCIICMLKSVAEIIVTICTAISTRLFSSEQSGRLGGMVLLALLAAVTISVLVYALIAVFKKQQKPFQGASLVLLIIAVLQAVVVGVAVRMTNNDELVLVKSLEDSFGLAKEENSRHVQLWASTQSELICCGLHGPEDYRSVNLPVNFPPNVPIACCSSYDSSRSDLVQERERETCKARKTYYNIGCKRLVLESVRTAAELVLGLTSSLIVLEIILAILALILLNKTKKLKSQHTERKEDTA